MAGVDITFHHLFNVICIEEFHAYVTNQHVKEKESKIANNSFFIKNSNK